MKAEIDDFLASFYDLVNLVLTEALHLDEVLLGSECHCLNRVESTFFQLFDVAGVDTLLFKCFDRSGTV